MSGVIIVPDEEGVKFTPSKCKCLFCYECNRMNIEFNHFAPTTQLQKRMKYVIAKIEQREIATYGIVLD